MNLYIPSVKTIDLLKMVYLIKKTISIQKNTQKCCYNT